MSGDQFGTEVTIRLNITDYNNLFLCMKTRVRLVKRQTNRYLLSDFVHFLVEKVAVLVEVFVFEHTFSHELVTHSSFEVHEKFKHLIIGFTGKHNFASI